MNENYSWRQLKERFERENGYPFNKLMTMVEQCKTVEWKKIENWENKSDTEILQEMSNSLHGLGDSYIVTEASYKKHPFFCTEQNIKKLIADHLSDHGESFYNGDVLFLNLPQKKCVIFHHEGVYCSTTLHLNN